MDVAAAETLLVDGLAQAGHHRWTGHEHLRGTTDHHGVGRPELGELRAPVRGSSRERAHLVERARVEQRVDSLAHGEAARRVLTRHLLGPTHLVSHRLAPTQLLDLGPPSGPAHWSTIAHDMNATGRARPASRRSDAMRRPGCTASLTLPSWSPRNRAVASRSATVNAMPQKRAGPSPSGVWGPTSSRIAVPSRKKVWRTAPCSRVRRGSSPTVWRALIVRAGSGEVTTTWSIATTPLGCTTSAG